MASGLRRFDTDGITSTIIGAAIEVHLRFADLHVGLLFNFNVNALAAGGWKRILRSD